MLLGTYLSQWPRCCQKSKNHVTWDAQDRGQGHTPTNGLTPGRVFVVVILEWFVAGKTEYKCSLWTLKPQFSSDLRKNKRFVSKTRLIHTKERVSEPELAKGRAYTTENMKRWVDAWPRILSVAGPAGLLVPLHLTTLLFPFAYSLPPPFFFHLVWLKTCLQVFLLQILS